MRKLRDTVGWVLVLAVLIGIPTAWHEAVLDDAFIAFRYAHNLVTGQGLVFNPGERVEGFTSPLWTLMIAAGMAVGADPAILAQVLAVVCNMALVWLVYRFGRRTLGLESGWAWAAVALLVADINLEAWSVHGLETNLFALLVFAGVAVMGGSAADAVSLRVAGSEKGGRTESEATAASARVVRAGLAGGVLFGAATWARPEGLVFLPVALGTLALWVTVQARRSAHGQRGRPGHRIVPLVRAALPGVGVWLAMVAALFLARFAYYGAWLPNTYFAKATGGAGALSEGLAYFADFVASSWMYGLLLIPPVVALVLRASPARAVLAAVVLVNVAYVVWLGGDTFKGARFFLPLLAPFALLVVDGLSVLVARLRVGLWGRRASGLVAVAALVGGVAVGTWGPMARQAELAASMTRNRAYLGRLLRAITPPDTLLALTTVGALPYYAERPVIDLYGLTDAHIARVRVRPGEGGGTGHEKGDGAYVLSRSPDLILLRNVWIADVPIEDYHALWGLSEHQIAADPRFQASYVPVNLRLRPDLLFGFYANVHSVDVDALRARFAEQDLEAFGPLERLTSERGMDLIFLRRGFELAAAGHVEAARAAFERSLQIYPGSVDAHVGLARLLEQAGDLSGAAKHLEAARAVAPSRADILATLGGLYARLDRLDEAAGCLKDAARLTPDKEALWRDLATLLLKKQDHHGAVPVLRKVVALAPDDHEAWVKLGVSAGLDGDWQTSHCALERAVALAPEAPEVEAFRRWFRAHRPDGWRGGRCPGE